MGTPSAAIPRETGKPFLRRPPRCSGRKRCVVGRLRPSDRHRGRMVRAREQKTETYNGYHRHLQEDRLERVHRRNRLPLRSLFQALLAAQFRLIFRMFARRIVTHKVLQPAIERVLRQAMHTAIFRPRQTAAPPRLDVNHPIGLPRLVLEMSQIHRRSSMQRRSPTCRAIALLNLGAETGRLPTTGRWRDKRPRGAASIGCVVSIAYAAFRRGAKVSLTSPEHRFRCDFHGLVRCAESSG